MYPYDATMGDVVVGPFAANGIAGETISVRTKLGTRVNAWRPTAPLPQNLNSHYFCHGYSLGTAAAFGYTVYSGENLLKVLADEYDVIGTLVGNVAPLGIRVNDILVWWQGLDACILPSWSILSTSAPPTNSMTR